MASCQFWYYLICLGVMKFNALLEWLQSNLSPDTAQRNAKQKPVEVPEDKRDGAGSKVDDAPEPVPEEVVAEAPEPRSEPEEAPPPEPEEEVADTVDADEPAQTAPPHEEL